MEDETCLFVLSCLFGRERPWYLRGMPETKYSEDWTAERVPTNLTTRCFLQGFLVLFFSPQDWYLSSNSFPKSCQGD